MIPRTSDLTTYSFQLKDLFESFFNEIQNDLFKEIRLYDATGLVEGKKYKDLINTSLDISFQQNYRFKRIDKKSLSDFEKSLLILNNTDFNTLNSKYNKYASPVIYNDSIKDDIKYFIIYVFLDKQNSSNVSNFEFLNSLTNSLLCYYSTKIEMKEDLNYDGFSRSIIYKNAGTDYFSDIAEKINKNKAPFLFQDLIKISELPYESLKTKGSIVLTNKKLGINDVQFNSPFEINKDKKMVRKSLELTDLDEQIHLYSNCNEILGIHYGNKRFSYDDNYFITFTGNNTFTVNKKNQLLLIVKDGIPDFPKELEKDDIKLETIVKNEFDNLSLKKQEKIIEVVTNLKKSQKHGAVIIISDNADKEAKRFSNMSITFTQPVKYEKNAFKTFTEIDGAIILDLDCNCHAIGVILDGNHKPGLGTSKRGSRYNGTLRYYETQKDNSKLIAIVISEDGYFNVFPES